MKITQEAFFKVISAVHPELRTTVLGKSTLATNLVNQDSTKYLWKIHRMKAGHQAEHTEELIFEKTNRM